MPRGRQCRVLLATDGSTAAKAATSTAIGFPWPPRSGMFVVVAKEVRVESRRSILLAALDQTAEFVARTAARSLARRWPDAQVHVVDASPVDAIVGEATRSRANVIVMGWRGQGLFASAGESVAEGALSRCCVVCSPRPASECHLDTQEFAHVVHGEQPEQCAAADDRDGMSLMPLQPLERDVDHVRCIGHQEITTHDVGTRA